MGPAYKHLPQHVSIPEGSVQEIFSEAQEPEVREVVRAPRKTVVTVRRGWMLHGKYIAVHYRFPGLALSYTENRRGSSFSTSMTLNLYESQCLFLIT